MPTYRKRPRRNSPPPLAGGGEQSRPAIVRGRGTLRSRQLRTTASDAEQKLWRFLRQKRLNGLRFRRQYPIGAYFADFVCLPARLVIEVDGSQHGEDSQAAYDARRTAWLARNNFRVIRFGTSEVMANIGAVMGGIEAALREQPLPRKIMRDAHDLSPPPARGGGNSAGSSSSPSARGGAI
jgi:very-short-patch-repair endonuclease